MSYVHSCQVLLAVDEQTKATTTTHLQFVEYLLKHGFYDLLCAFTCKLWQGNAKEACLMGCGMLDFKHKLPVHYPFCGEKIKYYFQWVVCHHHHWHLSLLYTNPNIVMKIRIRMRIDCFVAPCTISYKKWINLEICLHTCTAIGQVCIAHVCLGKKAYFCQTCPAINQMIKPKNNSNDS